MKMNKKEKVFKVRILLGEMEGVPVEAVVVEKQDPSELAGGVEVRPVDPGSAVAAVEDEGVEGGVEGGQEREIGRVLGVLVSRVDRGSGLLSPPLLVLHPRLALRIVLLPGPSASNHHSRRPIELCRACRVGSLRVGSAHHGKTH